MLVLKRRALRVVQLSAKVDAPAPTVKLAVGLEVRTPTRPPVGAKVTLPNTPFGADCPTPPVPGCSAIEPPVPPIKPLQRTLAATQKTPVPPVIRIAAPPPPRAVVIVGVPPAPDIIWTLPPLCA